ncbi:hypothetical protein P154DRAFT_111025 [Amniculicola lignicola CBS 123094]|uniref:Cell wall protein PhiA n=1 Tax=Amniculicola lignicola CBS 123094 TaxID=1392246 RepID=A0A6A5WN24_9PLEO|nr:hypothetical protein P154DRAFT_111025 [Amniculicola lignicola CBS 123094]
MKVTSSTVLVVSALAAAASAIDTTKIYQLRIKHAKQTPDGVLTVKEEASDFPNPLGLWLTDRVSREPYKFTFSPAANSTELYTLFSIASPARLSVFGNRVAMGLNDVPLGTTPKLGEGEMFFDNTFGIFGENLLRSADDNPNGLGSAASWRACKQDTVNDYQIFWYDGMSPLPIKNCEGISLEVEEAEAPASSSSHPFLTGVASPTPTASGFITGVPAPTTAGYITGVPSPSATGSPNSTTTRGSPSQFEGAGSRTQVGGVLAFIFGVLAFAI